MIDNIGVTVARAVDLVAVAFALGSTAWFFFVQSPVLIKRIGRDRFVPIQMRLTVVLFKSLSAALLIALGAAIVHSDHVTSTSVLTAAVALAGALINSTIVVPRALKAGGKSLREEQSAEQQASVARFAADGAGDAARFWHRAVVVLVVVMLAGIVPHALSLIAVDDAKSATPATELQLESGARWAANPATTEGVHRMLSIVRDAARAPDLDVAATAGQLDAAFQDIFERCTMTGAAHEELHRFLIPVGETLSLLDGSDAATAGETLRQLEARLEQYDRHFDSSFDRR